MYRDAGKCLVYSDEFQVRNTPQAQSQSVK